MPIFFSFSFLNRESAYTIAFLHATAQCLSALSFERIVEFFRRLILGFGPDILSVAAGAYWDNGHLVRCRQRRKACKGIDPATAAFFLIS